MDSGNSASGLLPDAPTSEEGVGQAAEALVGDGQVDADDGPIGVERGGEGDFSLVVSKKKKNDSLTKVSLGAALVLMLAMTAWVLYKKVLAPPAKPLLPAVRKLDKEIEHYLKKMDEVRDVVDEKWSMASDKVKSAFTSYYMPSSTREHVSVGQALSYYKLHVLEMQELPQPPAGADKLVKEEYLYKLQMLTSILDAAGRRLDALRTLDVNTETPALILGRESGEKKEPTSAPPLDRKTFLLNLIDRGVSYTPMASVPQNEQEVSAAKAVELLDLLAMEEKMATLERHVQEGFDHFLKGQGLSLKDLDPADADLVAPVHLPRDPTAMDTKTLVEFLHYRYISVEGEKYRSDLLDDLTANWSEERVATATELLRKHHKNDLKDLLKQKREMLTQARQANPPVPLTHGYPLAVFLL